MIKLNTNFFVKNNTMGVSRVLPVLGLFVVLLGSSFAVPQEAFATTITINDQASCEVIPGAIFAVGLPDVCRLTNDFTVNSNDVLIIEDIFIIVDTSVFTNFGTVELNGGDILVSAALATLGNAGEQIINECGGIINANGGDGTASAAIGVDVNGLFTNKGIINLFGGLGDFSGSLVITGVGNNHGTVNENPGTGTDSGIVVTFGTYNDNLQNLCSIPVDIDIKPGSDPNCISEKKKGQTPIAILGSNSFDVTTIVHSTIRLDDNPGNIIAPTKVTIKDVNNDGFDDLVLKFSNVEMKDAFFFVDNNELFIEGRLFSPTGPLFVGSDIINLAGGPNCF